ncbi:MAG TPA: hypothetical protein VGD15_24670 [Kribbella sp.]
MGLVGESLQYPNLEQAAVPPRVGRRGVQSVEQTERRSRRGSTALRFAALGGRMLLDLVAGEE